MPRDPYTGLATTPPGEFNFGGDPKATPSPEDGLDGALGRKLRDAGTQQAEDNAHAAWKAKFLHEAYRLIYGGRRFTSEDIITVVGMPPGGSPSAVGAMIQSLVRKNKIAWTGGIIQAQRPSSHAAMLKVWTRSS